MTANFLSGSKLRNHVKLLMKYFAFFSSSVAFISLVTGYDESLSYNMTLFADLKFLKNHRGIGNNVRRNANASNAGLWPSVFNLATKAVISTNATCGTHGREEFCRLSETGKGR